MLLCSTTLACALLLAWPQSGSAQATDDDDSGAPWRCLGIAAAPSGALLLGGKAGGTASRGGLDPFVHGGLELGYVFPTWRRGLGAFLQVEYGVPGAEGGTDESFAREHMPSSGYRSQLLQREFVIQPTFLYRMTSMFDSITPFGGVGLRVYLLESIIITAKPEDETLEQTTERSTELGGLPIGAQFALGPGALTGELMLQSGPLNHLLAGQLAGVSAFAGYRVLR